MKKMIVMYYIQQVLLYQENIKPLKTKKDTEIIWLTMYMGDMSDEEILDYIQRLDIEVYYSSKNVGK